MNCPVSLQIGGQRYEDCTITVRIMSRWVKRGIKNIPWLVDPHYSIHLELEHSESHQPSHGGKKNRNDTKKKKKKLY
jgi:hypothetical protein